MRVGKQTTEPVTLVGPAKRGMANPTEKDGV